jgi:hypothetical protein
MRFENWPEEWAKLTPIERFRESEKIFAQYPAMGGTLDPDPDPTSPLFWMGEARSPELLVEMVGRFPLEAGRMQAVRPLLAPAVSGDLPLPARRARRRKSARKHSKKRHEMILNFSGPRVVSKQIPPETNSA